MLLTSLLQVRRICIWLVAVLAAGAAGEARALSTVLGSDYIETRSGDCAGQSVCVIPFPQVPRARELLVTRVTCMIDITTNNQLAVRKLVLGRTAAQGTPDPHTHLTPVLIGKGSNGLETYQANNATSHPYPAGQKPQVEVIAYGPVGFFFCTLMGTYRNAPPT